MKFLQLLVILSLTGLTSCTDPDSRRVRRTPTSAEAPTQTTVPTPRPEATRHYVASTAYPPPRLTAEAIWLDALATKRAANATADATGRDVPIDTTTMSTYSNAVLGVAFSYPEALGDVEVGFGEGETGRSFEGGFTRFSGMRIAGRSIDYSVGRGGVVEDTVGFTRTALGDYLWLTIPAPEGLPIQPIRTFENEGRQVVIIRGQAKEGMGELYDGEEAILVNLAGREFPGMIMIDFALDRLPHQVLEAIADSIRVSTPASASEQ